MIRIAPEVVTKRRKRVTKLGEVVTKALDGSAEKMAANHAKLMEAVKLIGRPRVHTSGAEKQAAYRARKKTKNVQ